MGFFNISKVSGKAELCHVINSAVPARRAIHKGIECQYGGVLISG